MKYFNRQNFKIIIVVIVALSIIALILFTGYSFFKASEKATFEEFNKRQLILTENAAKGIELYFETIVNGMKSFKSEIEDRHLDRELYGHELLHKFQDLEPFGVNDMAILNSDGIIINNVKAPQIIGMDFSWRNYFEEAKSLKQDGYIIEFIEFKGVEVGKKGVLVAIPFSDNGDFAGVIVSTLKLNTVTDKFIESLKSSEKSYAFLIDDEKNLLWAPGKPFLDENAQEMTKESERFLEIANKILTGKLGTFEHSYYNINNSKKYTENKEVNLIAYYPISIGNEVWTVGIMAPKKDVSELIRSVYLRQLLLLVLISIIILISAYYLSYFIYKYNKTLEEEIEIKTTELEKSKNKLRNYNIRLEREVKKRTQELKIKITELENMRTALMNIVEDKKEEKQSKKGLNAVVKKTVDAVKTNMHGNARSSKPISKETLSNKGKSPKKLKETFPNTLKSLGKNKT